MTGPGGLPFAVAPALSIAWRAAPAWEGELFASGPFLGTVDTAVGKANVDQELIASRARFLLGTKPVGVVPFALVGLGVYHLGARGAATDPYVASSGHVWAGLAMVGLGLRAWLGPSIALVAEVDALVAAPRPVLRFAGQDLIYWGRPSLVGTLGGQVAW